MWEADKLPHSCDPPPVNRGPAIVGLIGSWQQFGCCWTWSLAKSKCHVKTDSCLPAPLPCWVPEAKGRRRQPAVPVLEQVAPWYVPFTLFFSIYKLWQIYSMYSNSWKGFKREWLSGPIGDECGGPSSLAAILVEFIACRQHGKCCSLLFVLSAVLGNPCEVSSDLS